MPFTDPEAQKAYMKEYAKKWYEKNREAIKEKEKAYRTANRDRRRKWEADRRARNPGKEAEKMRAWRAANLERSQENSRKWLAENKERHATTSKKWRDENRERVREVARAHARRNSFALAAKGCCDRAAKNGQEADKGAILALEVPTHCPVLGTEITFQRGTGQRSSRNVASIDKIAPEQGYVTGNMQIMSKAANTAKSDLTPEELLKFADWIYRTYGKQDLPTTSG